MTNPQRSMQLVFLGPPGAGKGTIAVQYAQHANIPHISTGDIFRSNIRNKTPIGQQVQAVLDSGELVPDDMTIALVKDRLHNDDTAAGFILDGFPRTVTQAEALGSFVAVTHVINFVLSEEELVKRLSGRRVHKESGRTYHIVFQPPKQEGKDDITGEPLIQREDDREEAIRNRLRVYQEQTEVLIQYYREKNLLTDLDASPPPHTVLTALKSILS